MKILKPTPAMIHSNRLSQQPTIWDNISAAINASTIKTTVEITPESKKIIYTAIGTLSAALIISAIINRRG